MFTLDHIDAAFDKISQVKYNQTVILKGNSVQVILIPISSFHSL
jgi:cleavage and polyadenylation specificity factor subunit 2